MRGKEENNLLNLHLHHRVQASRSNMNHRRFPLPEEGLCSARTRRPDHLTAHQTLIYSNPETFLSKLSPLSEVTKNPPTNSDPTALDLAFSLLFVPAFNYGAALTLLFPL